jgi:deoxyribonuclease V
MSIAHAWDLTPQAAITLQKQLAARVDFQTPITLAAVKRVAGVDVSVKANISHAAIVVLTFPELELIEVATAARPTAFPYISGLLSFREGPVILEAHAHLHHKPDVYLFDGMGVMHPRRLGIAAHLGLWWDAPTVGCGKTYLLGEHAAPDAEKGAWAPVWQAGEQIGLVLRTRSRVKPVYISAGHRATHETARQLIMSCVTRYRLPEPIRAAHRIAGAFDTDRHV